MSLSPEQYASGRQELQEVLREWDETGNSAGSPSVTNRFGSWFERIKDEGWTRKDVYDLVRDILDERPVRFSESTIDELAGFETTLTGFCAADCILRFPNEPSGVSQLVEYVRGNRWR